MKEAIRLYEKTVGIGILALALSGCNGAIAIDRNTVWYSPENYNDPITIEHEKKHQEQMVELGEDVFWNNYINSPEFRCAVEIDADAPEDHFACYGQDVEDFTPERIEEIFERAKSNQ